MHQTGYFVFAIAHPHSTPLTLPDGTFLPRDNDFFDVQFTPDVLQSWNELLKLLDGPSDMQTKVAATDAFLKDFPGTENTRLLAGDIVFLLSELQRINDDPMSRLHARLDLDRVGGLGHSFGGAIIGQAMLIDERIVAGINLDGWQFGDTIGKMLGRPFLLVRAGSKEPSIGFNDVVFADAGPRFRQIWIEGMTHTSFTDLPFFSSGLRIPDTGKLDPTRNATIVTAVVQTFFDQHLLGKSDVLAGLEEKYPEIALGD